MSSLPHAKHHMIRPTINLKNLLKHLTNFCHKFYMRKKVHDFYVYILQKAAIYRKSKIKLQSINTVPCLSQYLALFCPPNSENN